MALIEGRLHPAQESRARRHLASCDQCRNSLAAFEQLTTDVNLALRFGVHASNNQIANWWGGISRQVTSPSPSWLPTTIVPALLGAVLIALPFTLRLSGSYQRSFANIDGTVESVPSADSTNLPPFNIIGTEEPAKQHQSIVEFELTASAVSGNTPAPLIPAPLAPAEPSN
jgi:hypothetical protein